MDGDPGDRDIIASLTEDFSIDVDHLHAWDHQKPYFTFS